jgi:hypothetical protein
MRLGPKLAMSNWAKDRLGPTQHCHWLRRSTMEDEADLTGATPRRRPSRRARESAARAEAVDPDDGPRLRSGLSEGSLKPPIFLTSTFVFENAAAGKRHFEGVTGKRPGGAEGLVYSRFNGPTRRYSRTGSASGRMPRTR